MSSISDWRRMSRFDKIRIINNAKLSDISRYLMYGGDNIELVNRSVFRRFIPNSERYDRNFNYLTYYMMRGDKLFYQNLMTTYQDDIPDLDSLNESEYIDNLNKLHSFINKFITYIVMHPDLINDNNLLMDFVESNGDEFQMNYYKMVDNILGIGNEYENTDEIMDMQMEVAEEIQEYTVDIVESDDKRKEFSLSINGY